MAWTLTVYDQTGTTTRATFTDSDSSPAINGGFTATVTGTGDCVQMEFSGRNDLLGIQPRDIVHLDIDGNDIFWGVVVTSPSTDSPGAGPADSGDASAMENFLALGGRELAESVICFARLIDGEADVSEIVKEFIFLYKHPALTFEPTAIETAGANLQMFYKPEATLAQALDDLTTTVTGFVWGVDATGTIFFKEWTGTTSLDWTDIQNYTPVSIESSDVVTRVRLVVAGEVAGEKPDRIYNRASEEKSDTAPLPTADYAPLPVYRYKGSIYNSTYNATGSFAIPEGINPFQKPSDAEQYVILGNSGYVVDRANAYDDDGSTYAVIGATGTAGTMTFTYPSFRETNQGLVGWRIVYSCPDVTVARLSITYESTALTNEGQRYAVLTLTKDLSSTVSHEEPSDLYAVWPADARMAQDNIPADFTGTYFNAVLTLTVVSTTDEMRLYYFYPLILDWQTLDTIADQNFSIPSQRPAIVDAIGYYAPNRFLSVGALTVDDDAAAPKVDAALVDTSTLVDDVFEEITAIDYIATPEEGFITRFNLATDQASNQARAIWRQSKRLVEKQNYGLKMASRE